MVRPKYPVTERVVDAIRRGMARKGWTDAKLASEVGTTRQAVGQILSRISQRSEFLTDMLKAVGEPAYLVFDLSDMDVEMLALSKQLAALPVDLQREFIAEMKRRAAGELARVEIESGRKYPSTNH